MSSTEIEPALSSEMDNPLNPFGPGIQNPSTESDKTSGSSPEDTFWNEYLCQLCLRKGQLRNTFVLCKHKCPRVESKKRRSPGYTLFSSDWPERFFQKDS